MIKQTFEFIQQKLQSLQLFDKVFEYAELIDDADGTCPCEPLGEGNYKPINLGSYGGVAYLRKSGEIRFEKYTEQTNVGCEEYDIMSIPIRIMVKIKKSLLPCKGIFVNEYVIEELFRTISGKHKDLRESAEAIFAELIFKNSESDRLIVLSSEYGGGYLKADIHLDYVLIFCDIEARLTFNKYCLKDFCNGYE